MMSLRMMKIVTDGYLMTLILPAVGDNLFLAPDSTDCFMMALTLTLILPL